MNSNRAETILARIVDHALISNHTLKVSCIETASGSMIVIADDNAIYLLEFTECRNLDAKLKRLKLNAKLAIVTGRTSLMDVIEREIHDYFAGILTAFSTPFRVFGTPFQQSVWQQLQKIPYGETRSYGEIAQALGKPTAFRAVAQANGANMICVMIPCHRVINASGALGGYAGGIARKQWLLNHEQK